MWEAALKLLNNDTGSKKEPKSPPKVNLCAVCGCKFAKTAPNAKVCESEACREKLKLDRWNRAYATRRKKQNRIPNL